MKGANIQVPHALNITGTLSSPRSRRSTNSIVLQADAFDSLKLISQPRGIDLNDQALRGYYYDSTAGQKTTVYILDTGLEQNHPVGPYIHEVVMCSRSDHICNLYHSLQKRSR